MIWIFERADEMLRLETRYDNRSGEFLLIIHRARGSQVERFKNTITFRERLEVLETQLAAEQWTAHGPTFLHDGWKLT